MYLRMKNSQINGFIKLLYDMKLRGKDSRMRTRFMKLLQERYQLILEEFEQLQKEHAITDDNGNIVFEETKLPNGETTKSFKVKNIEEFNKDVKELEDEIFMIEINQGNEEMILSVRESIFNCDMEFSGQDALIYDALCEVFENIN